MKTTRPLIFVLLISLLCCACGNRPAQEEPSAAGTAAGALRVRVVDGVGTDRLVLAGEGSSEVYTVGADAFTVYTAEGAENAAPENGSLLTFDAGFTLLETWPVQLAGTDLRARLETAGKEDRGDLCGLYLRVLEDLWAEDDGLNADITYISVDLDDAPGGLSEGEKAAVAWIFAGRHNAEGLRLGFEALKAEGYIKENELYWEDGVLFSIKRTENGDGANKLGFDAEKWRSGTGAYFFTDCTAKRGEGVRWEAYKVGGFAIS